MPGGTCDSANSRPHHRDPRAVAVAAAGTTQGHPALSNRVEVEAREYPDSNEITIGASRGGEPILWKVFRAVDTVEYYDRESTEPSSLDASGQTDLSAQP